VTSQKTDPSGRPIAETLDRLIVEAERNEDASFAALARAAGLDPARDFIGASLADLDFRDEDLRGFDFSGADLTGADFRRANITGVRFEGAILTGAIGLTEPVLQKGGRKMARAERSGRRLSAADASIVKGMLHRGDRHHDIAAWFGVNQGRIAEVKAGELHPEAATASSEELPPQGSPGWIARIFMRALDDVIAGIQTPEEAQRAKRIRELAHEQIREGR
jgi:pentapeptide repeat protein